MLWGQCCALAGLLLAFTPSSAVPPHIVFILADDLGWNDVGFHGSNQVPTPNIDALAYSGVALHNYYVTPVCTPSRSALMTGKYPIHTGMQHEVIFGDQPWGLGLGEVLLPQLLKHWGYTTRAVGKWHLGHHRAAYLPQARGFDSHYGYWVGHQDYYDHTSQENLGYWGYDMRRDMRTAWQDYGLYSTDLFTAEAVQVIQTHNSSGPLFLYLAHLATHSANPYRPLQAPADTVARFSHIKDENRRIFAGMLTKLDESVGAVVAALSAAAMLHNSLIVFSTDNGGPAAGFNSNAASNWPLRGVKDTLWEGGVRGAGLVWSPLLRGGRVSHELMHITDWLPTLLHVASEGRAPAPAALDGRNVWPSLMTGAESPRAEVLLNIDRQRAVAALLVGSWKLLLGHTWNGTWDGWFGPSGRGGRYDWEAVTQSAAATALAGVAPLPSWDTVRGLRAKATLACPTPPSQQAEDIYLFDLSKDPCEQNNLAGTETKVLRSMLARLAEYNATVVPPRNKMADPRSNPKYWGYAWVNWMDYVSDKTI